MVGDANNNFNPKVNINRAEMSVLVTKAYNTLKGNTNTNTNTPTGTVTQYSGKVSEKTSSGSGYSITVTSSGKSNTFTTTSATKVTDANSKSTTVDKIGTGDSIVAVCSGGVATAIIIMSQSSESTNSVKGTINSISDSRISIKTSSKTTSYDIEDDEITVTIDGSNSSLSSLVSKFKGGSNFTATVYLDSDDTVTKIVATRGTSSDGDYDEDAIKSITSSKIKLHGGDDIDLPDDTDDITSVEIDGDDDYDFDDLEKKFKNLDDDEQMIVKDYTTKSGELKTIEVKIEDLDTSSSSSGSDTKGVVKSVTSSKLTLKSGTYYNFADEDDISKLELDDDRYDGDDLSDFIDDLKDAMDDDSVYVELTIKSKEITRVIAYTCTTKDGTLKDIDTSSKTIKVGTKEYDYTSSTTVSITDGDNSITTMAKLYKAIDDDDKSVEATVVLNDDDEVVAVTGYVSEVENADIKKFNYSSTDTKCYLTLDTSTSSTKYYFTRNPDFSGDCDDLKDLDDEINDSENDGTVTITLDEEGKITEIDVSID